MKHDNPKRCDRIHKKLGSGPYVDKYSTIEVVFECELDHTYLNYEFIDSYMDIVEDNKCVTVTHIRKDSESGKYVLYSWLCSHRRKSYHPSGEQLLEAALENVIKYVLNNKNIKVIDVKHLSD